MRKLAFGFVLCVILLAGAAAQAQATRTWVSGVGDDANPCSRTAPCKTYAGAISKTAAGGEISTLDPGGFGAVTITKSITISGDGTLASVLGSGTNGVTINAGLTDRVILRNLSINGANTGLNGIRFLAGQELIVDRCVIQQFRGSPGRAIDVSLSEATGTVLRSVVVRDSIITGNVAGIRVNNTSTNDFALVTVERSSIVANNTIGIEGAAGILRLNIVGSNISNNGTDGVRASGALAQVNIEDTMLASNNGVAVNAFISGARIRLANNTITNNSTGIAIAAGAFVESTVPPSNRVAGNGASAAPNATYTEQ